MKKLLLLVCVLFLASGCIFTKKPKKHYQPPSMDPPRFDLRVYDCDLGDWCPTREEVLWILESTAACHHRKFVEKVGGVARNPCLPLIDWREVFVLDQCSASWDGTGKVIRIYAGKDCSYTQGKTAQQMKRTIKSVISHAERHMDVCSSGGNSSHCQGDKDKDGKPDCQGLSCIEWCECCWELGLGC